MPDKEKEKKVFSQEVNRDDLNAAGGFYTNEDQDNCAYPNRENCTSYHRRYIYQGAGFPNCAKSVEDGSHCDFSDACYNDAIEYTDMKECFFADCHKAWH